MVNGELGQFNISVKYEKKLLGFPYYIKYIESECIIYLLAGFGHYFLNEKDDQSGYAICACEEERVAPVNAIQIM